MDALIERIEVALGAMGIGGPRPLAAYLSKPGPDFEEASAADLQAMLELLCAPNPNGPARLRFTSLLREWDNTKDGKWTNHTQRNTEDRRNRIHTLLKSDLGLRERVDKLIPFYPLEEPVIIAVDHEEWYTPQTGLRDYYWSRYSQYLREDKKWRDESLRSLENTTRAVVECLSNPESTKAYSARGIVVGHVQSGKTANFAGVIARAADAGYRLIIVLAGTWNILRNQTQRRLDKELLGQEALSNDEAYRDPLPADWDEFLKHGFDPIERGHYKWERLTRPDIDFKRLKQAIDNLEFEKRDKSLSLFHPTNLHSLPVKLLVIKKHSGILANLVKDLKLLGTKLAQLPTLIIDDESDQAGLNTADPRRTTGKRERSKTNEKIVELLKLFPRGQYVGYTATPYANALVDPDDPEDLFPKDFFVSLDRPGEYMGVSDFFDPETDHSELQPDDFSQKEIAFIRRVEDPHGQDDDDLKLALRSFVLSGAIKLLRQEADPARYRFRHHTMLIHTSSQTAQHSNLKDRVKELWDQCAFNCPDGMDALVKLWETDFRNVSAIQAPSEVVPSRFAELKPHLSEAISRIQMGGEHVLLVNSDSPTAPDFSSAPVWKIIIGGNKLSRGYTVEGLTTSYYRRVTTTGDTLMQMGRWFGFRAGYRDLVRVFLGVKDGPSGKSDLVALFKEVCLMEEQFRREIARYKRRAGGPRITPRQLPPLITVVGQLLPTARNKMFNATIMSRNYGGGWSQPTLVAAADGATENIKAIAKLLRKGKALGRMTLGGGCTNGKNVNVDAFLFDVPNAAVSSFLKTFRWLEKLFRESERPADMLLQIEFLEKQKHGITSWLVVAPQRQKSFGDPMNVDDVGSLTTKERTRNESGAFKVFGEGAHRVVATFLAGVERRGSTETRLLTPNVATAELKDGNRGIMLVYPVREAEKSAISIGFELLYPQNNLGYDINFTVRRTDEQDKIVVDVADD